MATRCSPTAASRKDNGQTGRKLVMDYYGPRIPLGGGAIYGKHPTHVDRFGARVARELGIDAVKRGAGECLIPAVYAPNVAEPLDVQVEAEGGEARVRVERLVLRGSGGSSARIVEFWPNPADIELERGAAPG